MMKTDFKDIIIPENNKKLATIFHDMAACYTYLGAEERYRAIAYERVSKMLSCMDEDITIYAKDTKSLDAIEGIGESVAKKIIEFLHSGKIAQYDVLKKKVPFELFELLNISGIGPATLKLLHEKLGINNKDDLINSLHNNLITGIKGMGTKKIENMNRALKLFKENERILYKEAFVIGNEILAAIQQIEGIKNADIAGSLRRKKETIGDIDIIIEAEMKDRKKILKNILSLQQVSKLIEAGITKATIILKNKNIQVDIRFVNADEYGAAMLYFTGSKEHNIKLRIIARNKGYKLNEYGLFEITTGKKNVGATEASIYNALGLKYIPPELRIGKDEIKNAVIQEKELV